MTIYAETEIRENKNGVRYILAAVFALTGYLLPTAWDLPEKPIPAVFGFLQFIGAPLAYTGYYVVNHHDDVDSPSLTLDLLIWSVLVAWCVLAIGCVVVYDLNIFVGAGTAFCFYSFNRLAKDCWELASEDAWMGECYCPSDYADSDQEKLRAQERGKDFTIFDWVMDGKGSSTSLAYTLDEHREMWNSSDDAAQWDEEHVEVDDFTSWDMASDSE